MTLEEAQKSLDSANLSYFIIGIKNSGQRGLPKQYEVGGVPATNETIFNVINGFISFRVFDVSEHTELSEEEFKGKAIEYFNVEIEKQERETLQKLKDKYESNVIQMIN